MPKNANGDTGCPPYHLLLCGLRNRVAEKRAMSTRAPGQPIIQLLDINIYRYVSLVMTSKTGFLVSLFFTK